MFVDNLRLLDEGSGLDASIGVELVDSPKYIDLGSCIEVCEFCGSFFWFAERVKSVAHSVRPRYNSCCKGGKVVLEFPSDPPDLLKALMVRPHFLLNIRSYNLMFSMTSFGATVDESINQGSGPYVFSIAGQVCH